MKISSALMQARSLLDANGVSNSRLDALILLSHAISISGVSFSKDQVLLNPYMELNEEQIASFFDLILRRTKREPVSHIINKREFFGEEFFVNKNVLDPRPDSESLIELVLKNFPQESSQQLEFLELGVGSGCLTVSLLKLYPLSKAIGVDISQEALDICQRNANNHQVQGNLELLKSDLFNSIENKKFDLIISNPPYISAQEIETLEPEVKIYEPIMALDGGEDGLDFYRRIASQAKDFLNNDGKVIVEIGYGQEDQVTDIFLESNFVLIDKELDLSSVVRVLCFK